MDNAPETAEEAVATAKKVRQRVIEKFPHRLEVLEENLPQKIKRHSGSKSEKLEVLYKATDEVFSAINPFTPCKKGCSACCHIPTHIAPEEAQYIKEKTGTEITTPTPPRDFRGIPCPFLIKGECSIYEHRPFVCRSHVVFTKTAYWCAIHDDDEFREQRVRISGLNTSFELIVDVGKLLDIRQVFSPQITSS